MIAFNCPKCGSKLSVPDNTAGKKGKCSQCRELVTVPSVASAPSVRTSCPPPPPPLRLDPDEPGEKATTSSPAIAKRFLSSPWLVLGGRATGRELGQGGNRGYTAGVTGR